MKFETPFILQLDLFRDFSGSTGLATLDLYLIKSDKRLSA